MIKVGHKGADHVAPGNTTASFDAALECGVDMIEFDVLPVPHPDGELVLAHDYEDAAERDDPDAGGRGWTTWPAPPTPTWSWTWTSSCRATRPPWSTR